MATKMKHESSHDEMVKMLKLFEVMRGLQKRHFQAIQQSSGVGGAQIWALEEINRTPGITLGQLARRLALHRSTTTNLVNRLEKMRLVNKHRSTRDQRNVSVEPTPRGVQVLAASPKPSGGLLKHALIDLPPAALRSLKRDLHTVISSMR